MSRQVHQPAKVFRSLFHQLERAQSLANDERWHFIQRRVHGSGPLSEHQIEGRDLRRQAEDDVRTMLSGMERAGALTRTGAQALTSVFAVACREGANFGDYERRAWHEAALRRAWKWECRRMALRRWLPRRRSS
jgi:hypothetical protein